MNESVLFHDTAHLTILAIIPIRQCLFIKRQTRFILDLNVVFPTLVPEGALYDWPSTFHFFAVLIAFFAGCIRFPVRSVTAGITPLTPQEE
jgi:hypothetical protein